MHAELTLSISTLIAFVLVLGRMLGVFVFVPLPVKDAGPSMPRIILALACAIALFPRWPVLNGFEFTFGQMVAWLISELGIGICIGLLIGFIAESITLGAQILSLQGGYAYASVVDPTTQADSDVLPVLAQMMAGLLFFTTGLHRFVIKAFADSLDAYPPGQFTLNRNLAEIVFHFGATVFSVGLRLAFPLIGLLLMTDLALALLGRISSQLHLSSHAFPAKMLLTLLTLGALLVAVPPLYQAIATSVFTQLRQLFALR
ncbi:MAG TPA: flagellar biosynthetic protein FliR [Bryobacteraceae bacterium]|jgi:flagellar biosynthetic protein FliR|nr:flagellar biosynthetic protein FliR [Bryobacteraceae bacterium]